ncbi:MULTISPECIES: hypothetical protein [Photorhabdus]|uniref:hypothetical protein n=1 Tax=Photorhabdus TaxID=29487 RepID=UPI001EE44A0A|nr:MULTISPECIES: hypothetical protein [Photorhabdus]
MTGVSECSQQRGNLKDDGYINGIRYGEKNKLLSSDIISIFGTGVSEIALLSLVYSITKSEIDTSLMVSLRLTASILVFVVIGGLTARFSMRAICISSDFFRAVTIFLAVFVNNIYLLFFISFLLSFFSGLNK